MIHCAEPTSRRRHQTVPVSSMLGDRSARCWPTMRLVFSAIRKITITISHQIRVTSTYNKKRSGDRIRTRRPHPKTALNPPTMTASVPSAANTTSSRNKTDQTRVTNSENDKSNSIEIGLLSDMMNFVWVVLTEGVPLRPQIAAVFRYTASFYYAGCRELRHPRQACGDDRCTRRLYIPNGMNIETPVATKITKAC